MKLVTVLLAATCFAGERPALVLEDFETAGAAARWSGPVSIDSKLASHGRHSARIAFASGATEAGSTQLARDWTGYDRLLFDIHYDGPDIRTLSLRVYDETGGDEGKAAKYDYFEARGKIMLQRGWNHAEIRLPLQAASYARNIDLKRIHRLSVASPDARGWAIHVDNFRLVKVPEGSETASAAAPGDMVSEIDNRWVTVRQVARPEDVPESAQVRELRAAAERERDALEKAIAGARIQGLDTIYSERRLVVAELGLHVRPVLAWFNTDEKKVEMFRYVAESCREERRAIEDLLSGVHRLQETDDTQQPPPLAPPLPHLRGRPSSGWFFRDDDGLPLMVLSVHSPSRALERFFASPLQHIESYTVGGASRWNLESSPVYAAFLNNADAKRVGWDGWCGHLVRDLDSMGGSKKDNVVICLESRAIRRAIEDYIRINIPKLKQNPELLYNIMAYELMYICYCDESRRMFHQWLQKKHGSLAQMNAVWGTQYKSIDEIVPPPVRNSRPLPGTNRALWYDWARFNQDRFTVHLLWVRDAVRRYDPTTPLAAGGSSSMLAGRTGTTGIDEERIVNEVDDVIIHEGAGSTMGMDLQLALAEKPKPLADPEMGLGNVRDLFPHLLHGKSVLQLYHWPSQPAAEYHSNTQHSWAHSWQKPLSQIDELLRVALDARRLRSEIASFVDAPAPVAILYSQTSTLQLPPEMLTWSKTPYLAELEKAYESSKYLDARVTFVTERQIRKEWLSRYKVLIVPGARNVPADVVDKIWAFASRGGRVLILPESLTGDEYNRDQPYLSRIGVTVAASQGPAVDGRGERRQAYDQTFQEMITFRNTAGDPMRPVQAAFSSLGMLATQGTRQKIVLGGPAQAAFTFSDGNPALTRSALGTGAVYYAAASLASEDCSRVLHALLDEAGADRALQIREWGIEARTSHAGDRRLVYLINFRRQAAEVSVQIKGTDIRELRDLRRDQRIAGSAVRLEPGETAIYEVFAK